MEAELARIELRGLSDSEWLEALGNCGRNEKDDVVHPELRVTALILFSPASEFALTGATKR